MLVSLSLPFLNLYLFVWCHTPAEVQHQKGPCPIHRAHGRCVCASHTTVKPRNCCIFVSFLYLHLDQQPALSCVVSNTSSGATLEMSLLDPLSAWAMCLCFIHNSQTQKPLYFCVIPLPSFGSTASTILCGIKHQQWCSIRKVAARSIERMGDVSVLYTQQSNPETAVCLCHSSTFIWIKILY